MNSRIKKSAAVAALVVATIVLWEGMRTKAYLDPIGIPTVCAGLTSVHGRKVRLSDRFTREECDAMFSDQVANKYESQMRRCLDAPDRIPDKSYTAMVSLTWNIGGGGFCKSSIAQLANDYAKTGDIKYLAGACNKFRLYNKAGGKVMRGLVRRRTFERNLCLEGVREKVVTGIVEGDDVRSTK